MNWFWIFFLLGLLELIGGAVRSDKSESDRIRSTVQIEVGAALMAVSALGSIIATSIQEQNALLQQIIQAIK